MDGAREAGPRDRELVAQVLRDSRAFGTIIDRFEAPLRRYLGRLGVADRADQDDLLQDVFIRVYEHLAGYDPSLSLSSWVYRIAHNTTMSMYRKRRARPDGRRALVSDEELMELASELRTDAATRTRDDARVLREALGALTPEYREVLVLRYFEYKQYDEISDILRIPPGTVATWLNRGKRELRTHLQAHGYTYGDTE